MKPSNNPAALPSRERFERLQRKLPRAWGKLVLMGAYDNARCALGHVTPDNEEAFYSLALRSISDGIAANPEGLNLVTSGRVVAVATMLRNIRKFEPGLI